MATENMSTQLLLGEVLDEKQLDITKNNLYLFAVRSIFQVGVQRETWPPWHSMESIHLPPPPSAPSLPPPQGQAQLTSRLALRPASLDSLQPAPPLPPPLRARLSSPPA